MLFVDIRHFHYSGCSPIHDVFFVPAIWFVDDCGQQETRVPVTVSNGNLKFIMAANRSPSSDTLLDGFLADTWWYGLTKRLSAQAFVDLGELRKRQGFSAVQIVVGNPPEVGPENENAASDVGPAWSLNGEANFAYLELARDRINILNDLGMMVIVYGAWGHQIDWLGPEKMSLWWENIVKTLDDCQVVYCLTGEAELWVGEADLLLPDLSTGEIPGRRKLPFVPSRVFYKTIELLRFFSRLRSRPPATLLAKRRNDWSYVLEKLYKMTERPLIIHPNYGRTGYQSIGNSELLSANTVQTGHIELARELLWQLPYAESRRNPGNKFINLEPWYEGITNRFYGADQMYAYWVSMLAGATSACYGAHGIWNVGDGQFLAHWGLQTFAQASALETPELLGKSHKMLNSFLLQDNIDIETENSQLVSICRTAQNNDIYYFPEVSRVASVPDGCYWLPLEGRFVDSLPVEGQVVVIADQSRN